MRRSLVVVLLFCAASAACTSLLGDFTVGGSAPVGNEGGTDGQLPPGPDGGDAGKGDAGDSAINPVKAVATATNVYLGQTAGLDGSMSTTTVGALSYAWSVATVPPGSQITAASLAGATTAKPTFFPDRFGNYVFQLTVSAGGASDSTMATVLTAAPQVFYATSIFDAGPGADASATFYVSDIDGKNARPVMCPDTAPSLGTQLGIFPLLSGNAIDFWEPPPGQPYVFAAFTVTGDDAGSGNPISRLQVGTSQSSCASPPKDLGQVDAGAYFPTGSQPSFSADGTRFVVYNGDFTLLTFAADGSGQHVVSTYMNGLGEASPSLDPLPSFVSDAPRPQWQGAKVAWARSTAAGWQIVTAPDQTGATPTAYMNCTGVTPRQFKILADGTVLVIYRTDPTLPDNLFLLRSDTSQNCQLVTQYTNLSDAGASLTSDFSVSPDGKSVAFLQVDPAVQDAAVVGSTYPGGYVMLGPVDFHTPPAQISPDMALYGPRFIGAGTALVYTRYDGIGDSGAMVPATSAVVYVVDGGSESAIQQGDGINSTLATTGNGGCSVTPSDAAPGVVALVSMLGAVEIVRRRRDRHRRS